MGRPTLRDLLTKRTPGTLGSGALNSSTFNRSRNNAFDTAIVYDVISNPVDYMARLVEESDGTRVTMKESMKNSVSKRGVSNPDLVDFVPRNSILAFPITTGGASGDIKPEILFPFFPAHLAFPAKPGEHVWIFYDSSGGTTMGYWLFRKTSFRQVDDVNFTDIERTIPVAAFFTDAEKSSDMSDEENELLLASSLSFPDTATLPMGKDEIIDNSVAYKEEFIGEPVPRYSKKCGDLVLQGSNNTLISLGTDKTFVHDNVDTNEFAGVERTGIINSYLSANDQSQNNDGPISTFKPELAGSIDLAVGRGVKDLRLNPVFGSTQSSVSSPVRWLEDAFNFDREQQRAISSFVREYEGSTQAALNIRSSNFANYSHYEVDKIAEESKHEGAFNAHDDTEARIYISMRSVPEAGWFNVMKETVNDSDIVKTVEDYLGKGKSAVVSSAYAIKEYAHGYYDIQARGSSAHFGSGVVLASAGGAYTHLKSNGDINIVRGEKNKIGSSKLLIDNTDSKILMKNEKILINDASEPYVLYSELKDLLEKITGDLAFYHTLLEVILLGGILAPFGGTAIKAQLDQAREAAGASGGIDFGLPDAEIKDADGEVVEYVPIPPMPSTFLGGNITLKKMTSAPDEILKQISSKLPSEKIFGN